MKNYILLIILLAIFFIGCKKSDDSAAPVCAKTVVGITGNYKLTHVDFVLNGGGTSDASASFLSDNCKISGVFKFKSDRTLIYTEDASCSGDEAGNWNVSNDSLLITNTVATFNFNGPITSWDCTTLKTNVTSGTSGYFVFYLTKQ